MKVKVSSMSKEADQASPVQNLKMVLFWSSFMVPNLSVQIVEIILFHEFSKFSLAMSMAYE